MKTILISFVAVMVLVSLGLSQSTDLATLKAAGESTPLGVKPATTPFSLIDFSRIRWSNSYSVSFFSGGAYSGSVGLLRTTMYYEFSPKLSMAFNLGVMHNASALIGNGNSDATFLPGFRLDWHPSSKFQMSLDVQRVSGLLSPYFGGTPAYWGYPW